MSIEDSIDEEPEEELKVSRHERMRAIVRWLTPQPGGDEPFMIFLSDFRDELHLFIEARPPQYDCPACQHNAPNGAKFCGQCGKKLGTFKKAREKSSLDIRTGKKQ